VNTSAHSELKVSPGVAEIRRLAETPPQPLFERPAGATMFHCRNCGHVERHDSSIPGICSFCPGIVELVPA